MEKRVFRTHLAQATDDRFGFVWGVGESQCGGGAEPGLVGGIGLEHPPRLADRLGLVTIERFGQCRQGPVACRDLRVALRGCAG